MMNWQDRVIKVLVISFLASSSLLWGRFYMGVEGGYVRDINSYELVDKSHAYIREPSWKKDIVGNGGIANLILGTEHFYGSKYFGLRWGIFAGYGFSQSKDKDSGWQTVNLNVISAGANFDMFFNYYVSEKNMSGIFVGLEYDFLLLRPNKEMKLGQEKNPPYFPKDIYVSNKTFANDIAARIGISTLIADHHRFEVMAKIPFIVQTNISQAVFTQDNITVVDRTYSYAYDFIQGLISYKYVF